MSEDGVHKTTFVISLIHSFPSNIMSKLCTICTAICSFFGSLATFILCTSSRISSSLRCTCHSTPCDSSCIPIVSTISSDLPTSTTFSHFFPTAYASPAFPPPPLAYPLRPSPPPPNPPVSYSGHYPLQPC
ncbi:uncharacterized protein LOC104426373 [Eucalyptus grandis]|uniref:uncharacterized protein LOC104426373 n=1 Tax=Eucalyptus grandis TaxID=71139 RepID=UPI00192E983E|nr:uncharacterized protein LOC104426373 [Eucalyptus grandis]